MGLPPDRAPRDEDWAWLNALAGKSEMASYEPLFSSAKSIRRSALFSRASSDDDGLYPEPTGNGFAKLKRRLRDAGLL